MEFREIVAPSIKELFVQQLEGMIYRASCGPATSFPRSGSWPTP